MEEIEERIKEIVSELAIFKKSRDGITVEDSLQYDLGIDSLAAVELLIALEETFNITIADEDVLKQDDWMQTIATLSQFIERKMIE